MKIAAVVLLEGLMIAFKFWKLYNLVLKVLTKKNLKVLDLMSRSKFVRYRSVLSSDRDKNVWLWFSGFAGQFQGG